MNSSEVRMRRLSSAWALAAVLGIGCGGGDGGGGGIEEGPSAQAGTVSTSAVGASVAQADTLRSSIAAGSGDAMAGGAISLSTSAMSAVTPKSGGALTIDATARALSIVAADTMQTGNKTCDMTGCTFDKYGVDGEFTISGSVKASDDPSGSKHVVWDLNGSGVPTGATSQGATFNDFTYQWKGDLLVSATALSGKAGGTWKASGNAQGQSFNINFGSLIKFNAVTLTSGCPTGGSVYVKSWQIVNAGSQSQNVAYEGTHTYTSCTN